MGIIKEVRNKYIHTLYNKKLYFQTAEMVHTVLVKSNKKINRKAVLAGAVTGAHTIYTHIIHNNTVFIKKKN